MVFKKIHFLLLLAAVPVFGDAGYDPAMTPPRRKVQRVLRPQERVFFTLDILVWDSREDGLEYAYKNTQTQSNQELTSFEPNTKFEPAFRIGFGGFLPYDRWILDAVYTYYSTDRHQSADIAFNPTGAPGPGMIAVWTYPSAFLNNNTAARFGEAKNRWKLHCSFLDLSLSRECPIGSFFVVSPEFGIRSAWLHQRYEVDYSSGNSFLPSVGTEINVLSSSIDMNCASNNIGPFFGCGATWRIGPRWNLFTDFSGSFLASRFHIGRGETDLFANAAGALQTQSIQLHNEYWTFRPQGQIALGFRYWDAFQYCTRLIGYSFSVSYEAQMWWKQNGLLRYLDKLNNTSSGAYVAPTQGDLMFHGVDLEAGMNF